MLTALREHGCGHLGIGQAIQAQQPPSVIHIGNRLDVEDKVVHCRAASISAFISRTAFSSPGEQRLPDDGVADVQLDDLGDGRHGLHIVIVQACDRRAPSSRGRAARRAATRSRSCSRFRATGVRIAAGVQLHHPGAHGSCRIHLGSFRIDEQ